MTLGAFFKLHETSESTHTWTLVNYDPGTASIDDLAECLADKIMAFHLRGCPQHYNAWKQRLAGGSDLSSTTYDVISSAYVKPVFGLPGEPIAADHLEGAVSQYLWYFLIRESSSEGIIRVEHPGFSALDHGGDGMVIHRLSAGYLMFRLWEIKKNTGSSSVSSTINTAYEQLNSRAMEYLARYTAIGQELSDSELANFYSRLVDFWVEATQEAAAGVAVSLSADDVPTTCFTTFGNQFPSFVTPRRLKGMLSAIDDFTAFSEKVQRVVWRGL